MNSELPPFLLLCSGRCGSTLLQRILNTSEHLSIWGEHNGALRWLAASFHRLTDQEVVKAEYYGRKQDPNLVKGSLTDFRTPIKWCNGFEREDVVESFRRLARDLFTRGIDTSRVRWGFKEIRYRTDEPFLPMWQELFPGTEYCFLVRHPRAVIRSMMLDWLKPREEDLHLEGVREYLEWAAKLYRAMNSAIIEWHEDPTIPSHLVRFEDLESNPESTLRELFDFAGVPMPANALGPLEVKTSVSRGSPLGPRADAVLEEAKDEMLAILGEVARGVGYPDW